MRGSIETPETHGYAVIEMIFLILLLAGVRDIEHQVSTAAFFFRAGDGELAAQYACDSNNYTKSDHLPSLNN